MNPEQRESIKSQKEIAWEQRRAEVDRIVDKRGKHIDPNIKEAVTALMIHEFPTDASCEGHPGEEHGLPYPWIGIEAKKPGGWRENEEKRKEWKAENLRQQKRMLEMMGEFYRERKTAPDARLILDPIGIFGAFAISSFGAELSKSLPPEEQTKKLELYRKELDDFTKFLKDKYFSDEKTN